MPFKNLPRPAWFPAFWGVIVLLIALPARAELPDPVRFGVTMEIGDTSAAERWLEQGLDPDFLADRVGTGLMLGAWEGNIALMDIFIAHGANINAINRQGEQALQLAAWKGHIDAVKWLLDHGASVNREGQAWSALHYAVFAGHGDIMNLLIQHGGDVKARAPNGSTVLMMAAHEGQENLVQPLLNAGADPTARNEQGDTALTWAMRYGHFTIAERVSSRENFAAAAQEPAKTWGPATRSVVAPSNIGELMRRIRITAASGQNTEKLQTALFAAIEEFKKGSRQERVADKSLPPSALMITAKRGQSGQERAELVVDNGVSAATAPSGKPRSRIADLLYQLRRAESEGQPTERLRQALVDAVSNMQR